MHKILNNDDFIELVASRARFTKSDVKLILETFIQVFEESARNNVILKLRRFGKLYNSHIPARKGNKNINLPPTIKTTFRLAENIRLQEINNQLTEE